MNKDDIDKAQEDTTNRNQARYGLLILIYFIQFVLSGLICTHLGRLTPRIIKFLISGFTAWAYAPSYLWFGAFPPPLLYFVLLIWHAAFFLCYYWITEKITTPKQAALWLIPVSWIFGYLFLLIAFGPAGMWQYATTWMIK